MNKISLLIIFMLLLGACHNSKTTKTNKITTIKKEITAVTSFSSVKELLLNADKQKDKTIKITGIVTHTCKHSGRRCFLADKNGNEEIRIEAGGKINGFDRELVGSTITVTGILKSNKLTKEYISQWEEKLKEESSDDEGDVKSCETEMNNIQKMRKWMKDHGKDSYIIYFLQGTEYNIVK